MRAIHSEQDQRPELGRRFEAPRTSRAALDLHPGTAGLVRCDADDVVLGLPVTLLLLGPDASLSDREVFESESEALMLVGGHPNVVTSYDRLSLPNGVEALVLERHSLPAYPDGTVVDPQNAVELAIKLAGALETAHRLTQLHCAVAPGVVARSAAGEPLLTGFSVGPALADPPVLHELTPHTAAELLTGELPTPATDVYGLGSALYELLSGRAAFRGFDGESVASLGLRVLHDPVPPLAVPGLPLELADVVEWAMASEPRLRPPSAAWLAEELGRLEAALGWPRTPLQVGVRSDGGRLRSRWTQGRHRTA